MQLRSVTTVLGAFLCVAALATSASAAVNAGVYTSTDIGGQLLTGRASSHRQGINSGLPHTLHAQSWNGALGTQWELRCANENAPFGVQDNRVNGTGTVVYTSNYTGGQFELFNTGGAWGDGVANLGSTQIISTVQFVNDVPQGSVVNGSTSGTFDNNCALTFAISNGFGVGETSDVFPMNKPADYPTFLDSDCSAAAGDSQFGTWGTVITIIMRIDCATPTQSSTWGTVKATYR